MSNNLNLIQISSSQNQKEVTANDKGGEIDAAITEVVSISVDDSNTYTMTNAELQRAVMVDIVDDASPPTADITLTVPAIKRGLVFFRNNSSQVVIASISGQTLPSISIDAGATALVSIDGTNVQSTASTSGLTSIRVTLFASGGQLDGELLGFYVSSEPFTIPVGMTGSYARVKTAPAAATVLDVKHNGSSVGSINFAMGASTATFTAASAISMAAGDYLEIVAPAPADASIADLTVNLKGVA